VVSLPRISGELQTAFSSVLTNVVPADLCGSSLDQSARWDGQHRQRRECCVATRGFRAEGQSGHIHRKTASYPQAVIPSRDEQVEVVTHLPAAEIVECHVEQSWVALPRQRVRMQHFLQLLQDDMMHRMSYL